MNKFLKIGEAAKLLGVSTTTLRSWEEDGHIKPHHKTPSGVRMYTKEQIDRYANGIYDSSKGR